MHGLAFEAGPHHSVACGHLHLLCALCPSHPSSHGSPHTPCHCSPPCILSAHILPLAIPPFDSSSPYIFGLLLHTTHSQFRAAYWPDHQLVCLTVLLSLPVFPAKLLLCWHHPPFTTLQMLHLSSFSPQILFFFNLCLQEIAR